MITLNIDPMIAHIGGFALRWYSLMVLLAGVVGVMWAWRATKRAGLAADSAFTLAAWGIPGGIIGARLIHILDQLSYYAINPGSIVGGEGEAITGAVLGGTLAAWLGSKVHKLPFGRLADLTAPGLILAQFIGRIGCVINGDAYGIPTSGPLALVYTNPNAYAPLGVPTQPAVFYEMAWDLVVFAALIKLGGRLQPPGSRFLAYAALYSFGRFFMDFLRAGDPFLFGLHQAQVITLLVLAAVIPILIARARWQGKVPAASPGASNKLKGEREGK